MDKEIINEELRSNSNENIHHEKERIASRLMSARFDSGKEVKVYRPYGAANIHNLIIEFPPATELIEKDLEGMPEILRIVWGYDPELTHIRTDNNGRLVFEYRMMWENADAWKKPLGNDIGN